MTEKRKEKFPGDSKVEMREMVMPQHSNPRGTVFGGQIMAWIDIAASMVASRHSGEHVVTAEVDSVSFLAPVLVGETVRILAACNFAGRTSMEIGVKVIRENPWTGECEHTTSAYLTFVALTKDGKPKEVPQVVPENEEDKRRLENAKLRRKNRMQMRGKLKKKPVSN